MPRIHPWARAALVSAWALLALDVTTSLMPSFIDAQMWVIPPRQGPLWWAEIAVALLGVALCLPRLPRWWAAWRALQTPTAPKVALSLFLAVTLVHIGLRTEHYPFTNVGMFSTGVPEGHMDAPLEARMGVAIPTAQGPQPVSFLREASALFGTLGLDLDPKAGWLHLFYAGESLPAFHRAARELVAAGQGYPRRCKIVFHRSGGALYRLKCHPPEPPP